MTESSTSQIWLEVKENCKRKFLLSNSPIIWSRMQGEQHNFMPIQQQSLDRLIFKVYLCWSLFVLKDQVILIVTNSSIPTTFCQIICWYTIEAYEAFICFGQVIFQSEVVWLKSNGNIKSYQSHNLWLKSDLAKSYLLKMLMSVGM